MAFGVNPIKQDFGQTISTVADAQRNTQFQTALQERFDVNSAKIEEAIQRVSAIPLLRDKDKEYLQKNMSNILNNVNANIKASGGRSLLNNNMSGQLTKLVGSSIDDYLVEQMSISAQKQQFDTQVAEERKKNPETFNAGNYQYSLDKAGWNEYIQGSEDSLKGGLQYIPYSDWSANATKKAVELATLKGERTVEYVDQATGVKTIKSIKGLKPEEVAQYLPNLLSSQDRQQMRIDGYMKGKLDPEGTKLEHSVLLDSQIEKANIYKKAEEFIFNTTTDSNKKANAKKQMEYYDNIINQATQKKNSGDIEQMGYDLVDTQSKQILIKQLSTEESIKYELDDVFKFNAEMAMAKAKLEVDAEANALKKEANAIASGTSLAGFESTSISQAGENMAVEDRYTAVKNEHDQKYNQITGFGLEVLEDATVDQGVKDTFIASLQEQGFKAISKNDGRWEIVADPNSKLAVSKSNAIYKAVSDSKALPKSKLLELTTLIEDKNNIAKALIKANQEFGKDVDTDELVDDLVGVKETLTTPLPFRMFDVAEGISDLSNAIGSIPNMITGQGEPSETSKQKRFYTASKINRLIESKGGSDGLKKAMKTNPSLAQQVITLLDEASDNDSQISRADYDGGKVTRNLRKAGEVLENEGWSSFFKDKSAIQITTEKAKEDIANSVNQNLMTGQTMFDVKKGGITATPYYNSRGQIEGFDIVQFTKELTSGKNDGEVIQAKARVTINDLTGKKLLAKLAQGDERDARKIPNSSSIKPMQQKIENPFPSDAPTTAREYDDFLELGLQNDTTFGAMAQFFNSGTANNPLSVKKNITNYAKSQLLDKYSESEIENMINEVNKGFESGEYTTSLKANKLPSQGTAQWVATIEKDGIKVVDPFIFIKDPILPKNAENYFKAYPQYVAINQIIQELKRGEITLENL